MIRYILVYAVLILIVVLMLWIGRRYSRGRINGLTFPREASLRKPKSQTAWAPGALSSLISLPGKLMQYRPVQAEPNPEEVKQAIHLLEDLYRDFETDMQRVRTDFSVALEAMHREVNERLSRLEDEVLRLTERGAGSAEMADASLEPETAGTIEAAEAAEAAETHSPQWNALSPGHREAIQKLREGIAVEDVAQELRLGVGEIAILKRLASEPGSE